MQHAFIKSTHFDPLIAKVLAEDGLDVTARSPAVQDAVWSTAVQHGPHTPVMHRAIAVVGGARHLHPVDLARDRRLIGAIYAERGRRSAPAISSTSPGTPKRSRTGWRGVSGTRRDALAMLDRIAAGSGPG